MQQVCHQNGPKLNVNTRKFALKTTFCSLFTHCYVDIKFPVFQREYVYPYTNITGKYVLLRPEAIFSELLCGEKNRLSY